VITLRINGKPVELERATPLHNGTIIERADYASVTLRGGDTVEIVRMVGGGLRRQRAI
jgi:sulfur carrier protein ThiS